MGASKHLVDRRDPPRPVLGSHKMVPWRFWQLCKANLAGKGSKFYKLDFARHRVPWGTHGRVP